jgi:coproporphyrinogen III oxidase-like Fe-S oxidoreductase
MPPQPPLLEDRPVRRFRAGRGLTLPAAPLLELLGQAGNRGRPGDIVRLSNPKDLVQFARGRKAFWGMEVEVVSPRDFLLETLMMGLRLDTGIPRDVFERRFGCVLDALLPGLWESWVKSRWAEPMGEDLTLTPGGRLVLDHLLSQAVDALSEEAVSRMKVTWP